MTLHQSPGLVFGRHSNSRVMSRLRWRKGLTGGRWIYLELRVLTRMSLASWIPPQLDQNTHMALVKRNNNLQLMAKQAGQIAAVKAGQMMLSPAGRELIWDGINWVRRKFGRRRKGNGSVVSHPGALPGASAGPIAISRVIRGNKPKFIRSGGSVTIQHREYLADVGSVTDGSYVVNNGESVGLYRVNPAIPATFPWLLNIASNFDQYRFKSVSLQYVPIVPTTTPGRVAMFYDKDSDDSGPADRVEIANMAHMVENAGWAESRLDIPTDNVKRFVQDSATADKKLVDLGRVGFATYGTNTATSLGDIFISYTVELFEPQPSGSLVGEYIGSAGNFLQQLGANYCIRSTTTSTATTSSWRFSPGTYMIAFVADGTAIVANPSITVIGNGSTLSSKVVFTTTEVSMLAIISVRGIGNRVDCDVPSVTMGTWNMMVTRVTRDLIINTNP